jgi:2-desacetyl-2-hydroxyethyl bacteriochlorophyllide A dehydrogenase
MRVLNIHGVGDFRLDPREPPKAGDNDVVIKVGACGICGSDLSYIKLGGIMRPEGGVTPIGHEFAGEIVQLGKAVEGVRLGQRVVVNPMQTSSFIGSGGPEGGFTEEVLVADVKVGDTLMPIPDDLPFEVAALTEPLAVALHGVNRAQVKPGDKVVVFGCGPIGLGMVLWLVDRGVKDVVALDLAPERLERALALGAKGVVNPATENVRERLIALQGETKVFGRQAVDVDAWIDAAGAPNILNDVIGMAKEHAKLVVTAAYMKPVEIHLGAMLTTEMTITTAVGYPDEMHEVVASLPRLKEKAASLISHRYDFGDIIEAFATAATPQSAKVMVQFEGAGA